MKHLRTFLSCMLLLVSMTSSAQKQSAVININGTVTGTASVIYLQSYGLRTFHVIDSSKITNGNFRFSKKLQYPEVYGLSIDTSALAALSGQRHPDEQTLP